MKSQTRPIMIVVLIACAMAGFAAWRSAKEPPETIPWRKSLGSGKPVLAYFTSKGCPPCQRMKQTTWTDTRVQAALEAGWVPVKIDVDSEEEIAREFGVTSIPRLQFIDTKGEPGGARIGFTSPDELLIWLQGAERESTMGR
jgi:thioredoxin-related protein